MNKLGLRASKTEPNWPEGPVTQDQTGQRKIFPKGIYSLF